MQLKKKNRKQFSLILIIIFSFIISGCTSWGDVSETFKIDKGSEPNDQDKMVRFRTTYYFRVVDSCKIEDGKESSNYLSSSVFKIREKGKLKIVNDSLYRFRMTGKANALFNTIHFESGILREEQIDPFGSTVKFNEETRDYEVIPKSQIRERTRRDIIMKEITRLKTLKSQPEKAIDEVIDSIIQGQLDLLGIENDSGRIEKSKQNTGLAENRLCPDGSPIKESYFLYGPEGVRKLDPDERLLMAMTIDSKPLISMLQQLSGKHRQSQQPSTAINFQTILEEHVKVSDSLENVSTLIKKGKISKANLLLLISNLKTQFGHEKIIK